MEGGARRAAPRALALAPSDKRLRAALRYCEGHLHRINGEAAQGARRRRRGAAGVRGGGDGVSRSGALRPNWPDPFLGLARTFIYGIEDIDRGADAMAQAQRHGHTLERARPRSSADGYRVRGETLERTALTLRGHAAGARLAHPRG